MKLTIAATDSSDHVRVFPAARPAGAAAAVSAECAKFDGVDVDVDVVHVDVDDKAAEVVDPLHDAAPSTMTPSSAVSDRAGAAAILLLLLLLRLLLLLLLLMLLFVLLLLASSLPTSQKTSEESADRKWTLRHCSAPR